jgi:hypothetical protein
MSHNAARGSGTERGLRAAIRDVSLLIPELLLLKGDNHEAIMQRSHLKLMVRDRAAGEIVFRGLRPIQTHLQEHFGERMQLDFTHLPKVEKYVRLSIRFTERQRLVPAVCAEAVVLLLPAAG